MSFVSLKIFCHNSLIIFLEYDYSFSCTSYFSVHEFFQEIRFPMSNFSTYQNLFIIFPYLTLLLYKSESNYVYESFKDPDIESSSIFHIIELFEFHDFLFLRISYHNLLLQEIAEHKSTKSDYNMY